MTGLNSLGLATGVTSCVNFWSTFALGCSWRHFWRIRFHFSDVLLLNRRGVLHFLFAGAGAVPRSPCR